MIRNLSKLQAKLKAMPAAATRAVTDELAAGASSMHSLAVRMIQRNDGGGRTYKRGGRTHVASAPFAYPNADRGELVRGMGWYSSALSSYWYSSAKHARPLEHGTDRMLPRPIMRPTYRALLPDIRRNVNQAIRAALRQFYA